ncbi:hypothetical protein [Streptomyces sp. CMB-StM0423]|uniref:hypothetical protein n=1 Tax=Streptomyces sp. CMB-StM0423 TaxID=2059884 RepID=UPI000C6FCFDE|nr:hypothetical protein [Streptomyces sp. CMB-StM0423]AUH41084.1 hypothetical protein CXR04_13220 [Streptomyces sp. CMB-StM0423]
MAAWVVIGGIAWLLAAGLVLVPSVILFDRPKVLVAPPYRHERGLLASRRRAREVARALGVRHGG